MPKKKNKNPKKLRRPVEGRKIGGVALALANYFEIDVILTRLIWALALIPGGVPGLIAYLICWVIIPEENIF